MGDGESENTDADTDSEYVHHDAELIRVDPSLVEVDDVNERKDGVGPETDIGDLEQSIAEKGIDTPPQARPVDGEEKYKVFAGQRRLLAAKTVGLPEIPLLVKDLDDMEALAASINENNEHLDKDVPRKNRAVAVEELVEEWDIDKAADEFGVKPQTVRNWLEPTRDFWSETIFDPEVETSLDTEYLADDLLAEIRRVTESSEVAEEIAERVIDKNVPPNIIRSAASIADNSDDFWSEIREQWNAEVRGRTRIRPRITLTGDNADMLKDWAKHRGLNEAEAVRQIVIERLEKEESDTPAKYVELEEDTAETLHSVCNARNADLDAAADKALTEWLYYLNEHEIDRLSVFEDIETDE